MQGHDTDKQSNVVSLFTAREKPAVKSSADATSEVEEKAAESAKFEDVMTKNARNQERLAKERANANKSVLKSYRIKH
jgi:hypothetical protein